MIKDLGLNNHIHQSDLLYLFFVRLRNYRTEAMFSIFKMKKIDQNRPKLDNQKQIDYVESDEFFHIEKSEDPQN